MISRITGELEDISDGQAILAAPGGLSYAVLVPAYTAARLGGSIGQPVTLHTIYFIEGQNQGATLLPRLAGFATVDDRRFFELFTTVRGIGFRKGLRAMALSTQQIAAAIAERDASTLQSLPEVGKRTAETIIASLRGKVEAFADTPSRGRQPAASGALDDGDAPMPTTSLSRDALDALVALGENRAQAMRWIDEALRLSEDEGRPETVEQLIALVYQVRGG